MNQEGESPSAPEAPIDHAEAREAGLFLWRSHPSAVAHDDSRVNLEWDKLRRYIDQQEARDDDS